MADNPLKIHDDAPVLSGGAMLLAFTGWMDGGEVSTGTVKHLLSQLDTRPVANINPERFYLMNFPGSMDLAQHFRPFVRYSGGVIEEFDLPANRFYCAPAKNLVLFTGKEPNMQWELFADCIFTAAERLGVTRIFFVGSFGGSVPHTREPRLYASVSRAELKSKLARCGVRWTEYEGPCSFATYLLWRAASLGIEMYSLAAEIPAYLGGANPLSIEAVTRRLTSILELQVDLAAMRLASDEWHSKVSAMVDDDKKLAAHIRKLEEKYDAELMHEEE